jgi:hypothetical protein
VDRRADPMTILPNLSVTADAVILTLENGSTLVLRTPTAARQHGDLCRAAEQHLDEMQRERATRLDREAAEVMNRLSEAEHAEWGSLQGWPPVPVSFPVIRACGCAKHERCADCTDAA